MRLDAVGMGRPCSGNRVTPGRRVLVAGNVPEERLVIRGLGCSSPVASNDTHAGRAKNRRVEVFFVPAPEEAAPPEAPPEGPEEVEEVEPEPTELPDTE